MQTFARHLITPVFVLALLLPPTTAIVHRYGSGPIPPRALPPLPDNGYVNLGDTDLPTTRPADDEADAAD